VQGDALLYQGSLGCLLMQVPPEVYVIIYLKRLLMTNFFSLQLYVNKNLKTHLLRFDGKK
jgi:hypothetical protein